MGPKKVKDLIKEHANSNNLSEEDIRIIINFYFRILASTTEKMPGPRIKVHGLGHFILKSNAILKAYDEQVENDSPKMIPEKAIKILEENLYKIDNKRMVKREKGYAPSTLWKKKKEQDDIKGEVTEGMGE